MCRIELSAPPALLGGMFKRPLVFGLALLVAAGALRADEPQNLYTLKQQIATYVATGEYGKSVAEVAAQANKYLVHRIPQGIPKSAKHSKKLAVVFDIGGVLTINHEPFVPQLRELLGIPDSYYVYAVLPIGFAAEKHGKKTRKPVREVSFYNRWDAGFDD